MRISTGLLSGFMILAVVFASGCSNPVNSDSGAETPTNFNFRPLLPSALTGDGTTVASRAVVDPENLHDVYGAMVMVPETALNYNGTVNLFYDQFLPEIKTRTRNSYAEAGTDYTNQLIVNESDGMNFLMRRNDDYSSFEYYLEYPGDTPAPYASEQWYVRIKSYPDYIHALILFYHTSTHNAYDSVEMIQTKNKIYTKCLRLFNMDDTGSINTTVPTQTNIAAFVGITDLSSTDNNTTGLRKNEMLPSTGYAFTDALPPTPSAYYDSTTEPNGQTYLYSYFNNSDNLVNTAVPSSGYISPTDPILLNMYNQGIQLTDIGSLVLDQTNGTGGRSAWHEWDDVYLQ